MKLAGTLAVVLACATSLVAGAPASGTLGTHAKKRFLKIQKEKGKDAEQGQRRCQLIKRLIFCVTITGRNGNNIADSAAGLANSIQGGDGKDIADSAIGLASSIQGNKNNKNNGGAAAPPAQNASGDDDDDASPPAKGKQGGGNNIADSAAGLANSIQGGNGGNIAQSAVDLASSIVGSIGA